MGVTVIEKQYVIWKECRLWWRRLVALVGGVMEDFFWLSLFFSRMRLFIGHVCTWPEDTKVNERLVFCPLERDLLFKQDSSLVLLLVHFSSSFLVLCPSFRLSFLPVGLPSLLFLFYNMSLIEEFRERGEILADWFRPYFRITKTIPDSWS